MRPPPRAHEPIDAKARVVHALAKVAAVGPSLASEYGAVSEGDRRRRCPAGRDGSGGDSWDRLRKPLIYKVPDEPALAEGQALEESPPLAQVACRVAHRVGILARDDRPHATRVLRGRVSSGEVLRLVFPRRGQLARERVQPLHERIRRIHWAQDVGARGAAAGLVLHRPGRLVRSAPHAHGVVVSAVAGLVAERPTNDACVIFVPLDHAREALHKRAPPGALLGERAFVADEEAAVRLAVRLVDHIQA